MPVTELIPLDFRARGPWLIDQESLRELDKKVGAFLTFRTAGASPTGADTPERSMVPVTRVTVFMRDGNKLQTSSLEEALNHPPSQTKIATGFSYEVSAFDYRGSLTICRPDDHDQKEFSKDEEDKEYELQIKTDPPSSPASHDLYGLYRNWVSDVQPPVRYRWLLGIRPLAQVVLIFLLVVGGLNFAFPSVNQKEVLREEARQLVKDGVTEKNQQRALELLLAIQSDYTAPQNGPAPVRQISVTFLFVAAVLGIFSAVPRISIGIWAAKNRLRRWRAWLRFVNYTIPLLVTGYALTRYVWPQLFSTIEAHLHIP